MSALWYISHLHVSLHHNTTVTMNILLFAFVAVYGQQRSTFPENGSYKYFNITLTKIGRVRPAGFQSRSLFLEPSDFDFEKRAAGRWYRSQGYNY